MMKKAAFLDRDGVINRICYHHDMGIYSARNLKEFEVLPKAKEAISALKRLGFMAIVVTNQPGFAFGYLFDSDVDKINDYMKNELGIDCIYTCKHSPEDRCGCRKPKPGLILAAAKEHGIDLKKSYMIGDNLSDIESGKVVGKTFFIGVERCDICRLMAEKKIKPDYIVKDLYAASEEIKRLVG